MLHSGFTGKTNLKEEWYGTEYNIAPFDSVTQTERWTGCLQGDSEYKDRVSLPLMNPFVPTDFTIRNTAPAPSAPAVAVGGAENVVGAAVVIRSKPELLEYVTTVTIESEDADAHDIDTVTDAASALSITEGAVSVSVPVTEDAAEDSVAVEKDDDKEEEGEDEDDGCEEDDEQDVPVGSLPPLQGKVIHLLSSFLCSNSTTH